MDLSVPVNRPKGRQASAVEVSFRCIVGISTTDTEAVERKMKLKGTTEVRI